MEYKMKRLLILTLILSMCALGCATPQNKKEKGTRIGVNLLGFSLKRGIILKLIYYVNQPQSLLLESYSLTSPGSRR